MNSPIPGPPVIFKRDGLLSELNLPANFKYDIPGPMVYEDELSEMEREQLMEELVNYEQKLLASFLIVD